MDIKEVKYNLNRNVIYNGTQYRLTGCILRLNQDGFYYEAELIDLKAQSSLLICRLNEITTKCEKKNE